MDNVIASEGPPGKRDTRQVPCAVHGSKERSTAPGNRLPCITRWQLFSNNSSLINKKSTRVQVGVREGPTGEAGGI